MSDETAPDATTEQMPVVEPETYDAPAAFQPPVPQPNVPEPPVSRPRMWPNGHPPGWLVAVAAIVVAMAISATSFGAGVVFGRHLPGGRADVTAGGPMMGGRDWRDGPGDWQDGRSGMPGRRGQMRPGWPGGPGSFGSTSTVPPGD